MDYVLFPPNQEQERVTISIATQRGRSRLLDCDEAFLGGAGSVLHNQPGILEMNLETSLRETLWIHFYSKSSGNIIISNRT
jgi:hypothetical protein